MKLRQLLLAVCSIFLVMGAYPPGKATISVSPPSVVAGTTFSATACGFAPGEAIAFTIDGQAAGTAVAGSDGCATAPLVAPAQPGAHSLIATGQTSGITASGTFMALASDSPVPAPAPTSAVGGGPGNLPTAGQSIGTPVRAAIGLVIAGLGAIALTTHRNRNQ